MLRKLSITDSLRNSTAWGIVVEKERGRERIRREERERERVKEGDTVLSDCVVCNNMKTLYSHPVLFLLHVQIQWTTVKLKLCF